MSQAFYHAVFTENFKSACFKNNIAIIDEVLKIKLTYKELHLRVMEKQKNIKNKLIEENLDNEKKGLIALNINKNSNFIIAQLACSYLDLPFLPLDTVQKNRNNEIISIIKPILILTDNEIIYYPEYQKFPREADYVIFSSGSTGNPKGIIMKGQPAINIVSQQASIIGMKPGDKYIWLLSPAFDASLSDIYSTFVSRGILIIPNFDTTKIKKLCKYIQDEKIAYMDLPPSMFYLFYKVLNNYKLDSLKGIVFGGESASEIIIKSMCERFNMFQAYGPTETTICSSMNKINVNSNIYDIGTPLNNVEFKILNNELLISGNMLSLGYFDNEILNKDKFIKIDDIIWFKTGDYVSLIENQYIYKGRLDRQFKINSQLISPEEIENKAIRYGASFSHVHFDGKIHLYYQGELQIELFKESLATYMIPNFIHSTNHIDNISNLLNSNHKFDHKLFLKKINDI